MEGDSTTALRSLEVSISFGRFDNDLLSWEKWSSFSQNKYLEEVEKCATPGSVAAKKAFFEARNKLIGVRKAVRLNKQMEACQELKEVIEIQNSCVSEVGQYDEEMIKENLFGTGLSSPSSNEYPDMQSSVCMPRDPDENDAIEVLYTDDTIPDSEMNCPLVVDYEKKDSSLCMSESETPNKDGTEETTHESISEFDDPSSAGRVQEKHISMIELGGAETDQLLKMQSFVVGSAQSDGEEQLRNTFKISSQFVAYSDALEDFIEDSLFKSELSPRMLDQLKVDNVWSCKSPPRLENEHSKSKVSEDIPASNSEKINVDPASNAALPNMSAAKNARTQKAKPHPHNSSKKIYPAKTQNSAQNVKKILVSSVPGSPQKSTPKTSRLSVPAVNSAPSLLPASRVKKIPVSAPAVPKSPQIRSTTKSTLHSAVSSLKQSSLPPSKKRADLLSSRKKIISPVAGMKPTPRSLHMSLNLGSKVPGSISGSIPGTEPRKSLFLEKMGDKDIVKRAFRAFQYMSSPNNIETNATSKKVVRDMTDVKTSTPILQKEKDRMVKKSEVDVKSKKPIADYAGDKLTHSKADKRKEAKKVVEKTEHLSKFKEFGEACSGDRRQSITCKAATQPGLLKRQDLSKNLQDK